MNQAAKALQPSESPEIEKIEALDGPAVFPTPRIHAVAVNATEMAEANEDIKQFLRAKVAALQHEKSEVEEALDIAVQNGWKMEALSSIDGRLAKQIPYYQKLIAALDAGYTVVPNMPCDQFAIRVKRKNPLQVRTASSVYGKPPVRLPDEKEQILDPGEGRYVSPRQLVEELSYKEQLPDNTTKTTLTVRATEFDAVEFPLAAAVPVVMSATQAAMSLKLFDRIGLVPQEVQRDMDPIVLGQIVLRMNGRERVTSFLIAWHLDMRTL